MSSSINASDKLSVAIAQIAPVWLDRTATLSKITQFIADAGNHNCQLVCFGEAILPGYPFWIERSDGARFNSKTQKEIHAHYMNQAIQIEAGHLNEICQQASQYKLSVIVGCVERAVDRGGHSLYCSLVYINQQGIIASVHRKLMPTYEERLTWAAGDGHGLKTHPLAAFTVGALNCWENWMPLPRAALYAQGEDLHVAIWPGSVRNTEDITRFIAKESRSYVISASSLMRAQDFPKQTPHLEKIIDQDDKTLADGGSCIAAPDGSWLIEPVANEETLLIAELDHQFVRQERQNFDPAGHYSRPDVTQLIVNRKRQSTLKIED